MDEITWFKVDDNLAFHSKVVLAGNAAMGLWVRAGSWAAQQLTDGFIPDSIAGVLGTEPQVAKLVKAGLWHEVSGGFQFHSWEERQPKREQIEAERAAIAERKRISRARKKAEMSANPLVNGHGHADVTRRTEGGVTAPRPDPTRPDPTYVPKGTYNDTLTGVGTATKRGTRIDPDFIPSEKARATIIAEHPSLDIRREHSRFIDYWLGQPGQRGTKLDWDATWRNWMRRAADDSARRPRSRQQETDDLFAAAAARMGVTESTTIEGSVI